MTSNTEKAVEKVMKSASANAHAGTDMASKVAHDLIDRVARRAELAEESMRRTAVNAEKKMRQTMRMARERGVSARGSVGEFVRQHPFAAIGIALGAGALLSSMRRRGDRRIEREDYTEIH